LAAALTTMAVVLHDAPAEAAHPDKDLHIPFPVRSDYGLHAWWWSAKQVGSTFPALLYGRSEVTDNVFVDFELPWTFTADTSVVTTIDEDGNVEQADPVGALGNPTLFVRYGTKDDIFAWTVGGGVSAPLGLIDNGPYRIAMNLGSAAMGLYHPYLWAIESLPIVVRSGFELRLARPLFLRLEVDPFGFVPLGGQDFLLGAQEKIELEARAPRSVGGGIALHAVEVFTPEDGFQAASEVFFSYDDEEDFFFRLGVLLALDEPLGFGFDEGKVFSGHVLVGSYFEED
jgi:hypothetical protein